MRYGRLTLGILVALAALAPIGMEAQERRLDPTQEAPAKAPGTMPSERDIFVPIYTEPVDKEKGLPASVRRERADFVWTGVPLPASRVEPAVSREGPKAVLLALRHRTAAGRSEPGQPLTVVIRLKSAAGARPFLEVVDGATMLQSRGWGRLTRSGAEGSDWLFTLTDPVPPRPGTPNPVSARLDMGSANERKFELRLVSNVPEQK